MIPRHRTDPVGVSAHAATPHDPPPHVYGAKLRATRSPMPLGRAVVVSTDDPESLGRIKVLLDDGTELWAAPCLHLLLGGEVAPKPGDAVWMVRREIPVIIGRSPV
jgi:hypothetical protein